MTVTRHKYNRLFYALKTYFNVYEIMFKKMTKPCSVDKIKLKSYIGTVKYVDKNIMWYTIPIGKKNLAGLLTNWIARNN